MTTRADELMATLAGLGHDIGSISDRLLSYESSVYAEGSPVVPLSMNDFLTYGTDSVFDKKTLGGGEYSEPSPPEPSVLVSIATPTYSNTATSRTITTSSEIVAGDKAVLFVHWYGGANIDSIVEVESGLVWEVHEVSTGVAHRTALVSAPAPIGLPNETEITVTMTAQVFALGVGAFSCNALGAEVDSDFQIPENSDSWVGTVDVLVPAVIVGGVWFDFYSGGISPIEDSIEVLDWVNVDGSKCSVVYREVADVGEYTVGGTASVTNPRTSVTVAFGKA